MIQPTAQGEVPRLEKCCNERRDPSWRVLVMLVVSVALADAQPRRIVSLVPSVTEMLFAIGAGPQVVGVSSFDKVPAEVETRVRVGALLVMQDDTLLGIISERDYTRKIILLGRASKDTRVEEVMSSSLITVRTDTSLNECLAMVTDRHIRHLPVIDEGRCVGLLSIGDLVRAVVAQQAELIRNLKSFIGSDYPT